MKITNIDKFKSWVTNHLTNINPEDIQDGEKLKLVIALDSKSFTNKSLYKVNITKILNKIYDQCLDAFDDGSISANEGLDSFLDIYCYILAGQETFMSNKFIKIEDKNFSKVYSRLGLGDAKDSSITTVTNNKKVKDDEFTFYIIISDFEFTKSDKFKFLSLFKAATNKDRVFYFVLTPKYSSSVKSDKLAILKILDRQPINTTAFVSINNPQDNEKSSELFSTKPVKDVAKARRRK